MQSSFFLALTEFPFDCMVIWLKNYFPAFPTDETLVGSLQAMSIFMSNVQSSCSFGFTGLDDHGLNLSCHLLDLNPSSFISCLFAKTPRCRFADLLSFSVCRSKIDCCPYVLILSTSYPRPLSRYNRHMQETLSCVALGPGI